jgi:glucose/arabinose dehydrogenase
VVIENGKKVDEEIIFDAGSRVRDVEVGPGGLIYVALEDPGRIVRLSPL